MALAPSIEVNDGRLTSTGIVVALQPAGDPNAMVELWRAPDLAGAPDTANALMVYSSVIPLGGINFVDQLKLDGATWWYRLRTNGGQYGPGPYTEWQNLGAADRLVADSVSALVAGDGTVTSAGWQQQNARIGPQGNLLPNPGFEEDGLPWWYADVGTAALITNSANAQSGNRYAQLTSATGVAAALRAVDDAARQRYFEVNTNDVVQWGGWAYRESGTANVRYVVELTDKDKLNPTLFTTPNQNTAAWLQLQAQTIVGAGKKYARVWAEIDATGTGVVARFDDAYLRVALGAIYDTPPPSTLYEIRFANAVPDPDGLDGLQTYIDFPATTNFLRIGQAPLAIVSSTAVNPSVVTVTIRGHLTNTAINGTWTVTVTGPDTFTVPVLGTGAGGATGHVVKLQLTVDSLGNLVVYAIIQATSLVVSGLATFNGLLTALAGALFRSLQHSTAGNYGDTTTNRVMLENNAVKLLGDAKASGGENNEAVRLGSYSITGSPTARTTAAFDSPAVGSRGWNDPDGTDNGKNSLVRTSGGGGTVVSTSRLY